MIKNRDKNLEDIIILGGSFNPVHNGHIAMAEAAFREFGRKITFMPNSSTYYKESHGIVSDEDRLAMLKLLADEMDFISVSDMEIRRGGITKTIDTIRELEREGKYENIFFIIGGDSLEWVDKWVDADELLSKVIFLAVIRGETDRNRAEEIIARIKKEHPASNISILDMDEIPISSTDIRDRVRNGESIKELVPEVIENYILQHNLYKGE